MQGMLFGYYLTRFQVFILLFFAGVVGSVIYWILRKGWQRHLETVTQALADCQDKMRDWQDMGAALEEKLQSCDPERVKDLYVQLQSFIGHEITTPLADIREWGSLSLEGLESGQDVLRTSQKKIIDKASRLLQRVINIQEVFAPEKKEIKKELLNMRLFVEAMLRDDFLSFAASNDVTLLTTLADVKPTLLNRDLTSLALENLIHNAIKYSRPGGVVEIVLSLKASVLEGVEKAICVDVKDTGQGIPKEQHQKIFDLRDRGDGPIKHGQGLGLFLARRAARLQKGDVILVRSSPNQGSVFRILLPYGGD